VTTLDKCIAAQARQRKPIAPGTRFGRLIVLWFHDMRPTARYHCVCDCGTEAVVFGVVLRRGDTRSCGCLAREDTAGRRAARTKHGMYRTPTYKSWKSMVQRCCDSHTDKWRHYGGVGVTVCDRWNPKAGGSFENFLADMGGRPEGTTLGRFGDVGDYEPGNCAWQTDAEQKAEARAKRAARRAA
jgi:hypothetical protein